MRLPQAQYSRLGGLLLLVGLAGLAVAVVAQKVPGMRPPAPGGGTGGEKRMPAVRQLTRAHIARIGYAPADQAAASSRTGPGTVFLLEPAYVRRDGLYIYRDDRGIWHIRAVFSRPTEIRGTILASVPCQVLRPGDIALRPAPTGRQLTFGGVVMGREGVAAQFGSPGGLLEFDLTINGRRNAAQVVLGASDRSPAVIPFRLESRGIGPRDSSPAKQAQIQHRQPRSSGVGGRPAVPVSPNAGGARAAKPDAK